MKSHERIAKAKLTIHWKKKLEIDIKNVIIEPAHQSGKKNKNRLRPIVAQCSIYKDKINILKN